jgi:hypothetical protein
LATSRYGVWCRWSWQGDHCQKKAWIIFIASKLQLAGSMIYSPSLHLHPLTLTMSIRILKSSRCCNAKCLNYVSGIWKKVKSFHWEVTRKASRSIDGDHELPKGRLFY